MAPPNEGVPVSQSLGRGTVGHPPESAKAVAVDVGLKALARKSFQARVTAWRAPVASPAECPTHNRDVGHPAEPVETPIAALAESPRISVDTDWATDLGGMDSSSPLPGFTLERWEGVIKDAQRFLDRWGVAALSLDWTAEDLFGVHPVAPAARYDCMGLVPLISGGEVIDMRTDRATIRMTSGNGLVYYLRRPNPDAVPIWDLARRSPPTT